MKVLIFILISMLYGATATAELSLIKQSVISDSEEPTIRRIYSYDFDVSPDGTIHAVYLKPVPSTDRAQVIYMTKPVGGEWPAENQRTVLDSSAYLYSISTNIIYDAENSAAHVSYIARNVPDKDNIIHTAGLVYQKISKTADNKISVGSKVNVSPDAFHTLMQLNEKNQPIFLREFEVYYDENNKLRPTPFPKALRILLPLANNQWTDREHVLNLPSAEDYRVGNFIYDKTAKRYHITYGNKNAQYLRDTYLTTNPPVKASDTPTYFPPGVGHQLIYAVSDDLKTWKSSVIDPSGNISENEFWTDLIKSPQGNLYSANYRYKTDAKGIQEGSTSIFATLNNDTWTVQTVAGATTGASEPRAGMGPKILLDDAGGFHGVWDDSPDAPIDSESPDGTIVYHYSPDGKDWLTHQTLLPFSAEGKCRAKFYNDKLLLMVLGNAKDAKLNFAEFQMPAKTDNVFEVATEKMFYGLKEKVNFHVRFQSTNKPKADLYLVVAGPFDKNSAGELISNINTEYHYLGEDNSWHQVSDPMNSQPGLRNYQLRSVSDVFRQELANAGNAPFKYPARYKIYSVALEAGTSLSNFQKVSPLYKYELHACVKTNCQEFVP